MKFELFIARKLQVGAIGKNSSHSSPILSIVLAGIVIALVIMILSITIICGFKDEITTKIYSMDSHIKILSYQADEYTGKEKPIDFTSVKKEIAPLLSKGNSIELVAEKQCIFKTNQDFKGIVFRGVEPSSNMKYWNHVLISGRLPILNDSTKNNEIIISKAIAKQLALNTGNKILTYFIDDNIKIRNLEIVGIYNTDFDSFDNNYIIGNISLVQNINQWEPQEGSYAGVVCENTETIDSETEKLANEILTLSYKNNEEIKYQIKSTKDTNMSYFTWLDLLDMNVVVIIILMTIVSGFTLIAGLLIIVLGRVNMIGILKALGANNSSIRSIFIFLTQKLIIKAILIGNIIGISLALIQKYFHIISLDPESYYMSYVPISFNILDLLLLNIGAIIVAYITLLAPSYIISTIQPSKSIKFD